MSSSKPHNYLRAFRKQSGLTQREAAFLMGRGDRAHLARLELRHRNPPLETALACEDIFGSAVADLYAGFKQEISARTIARMQQLRDRVAARGDGKRNERLHARKIQWLDARIASLSANQTIHVQ